MWAIQYGRLVEVLSPADLREAIRQDVTKMAEKYQEKRA
jgi:predicted DNA-binding transcriptional regulator YafY